jgi:coenzyme F420-reducing hydrogenase beta subunit
MKPAINEIGESRCTGCYSCQSSCPKKAITMSLNDNGFLMPSVDTDKCTNCGLCQQYCPILNPPDRNSSTLQIFAASSKDETNRLQSSSGGIFSELARSVFREKGVVFGAAFDKSFRLRHCFAETEQQLVPLRGSKYIQSQINNAYQQVIALASQGRAVLFCGTPCQIAALSNHLNMKGKAGLAKKVYLCDIICHGVGSQFVFDEYLAALSNNRKGRVIAYGFRGKHLGWKNFGSKAVFSDGSKYFEVHRRDKFMLGYLGNIFLRDSCYSCPFATVLRHSDITLGDFWGAPKGLYDKRGVSVVVVNTPGGMDLFRDLDVHRVSICLDQVTPRNPRLVNGGLHQPLERTAFFQSFKKDGFEASIKKYAAPNPKYREYLHRFLSAGFEI